MPRRDTPWPNGTPCWVELSTTDLPAAQEFYGRLFGWELDVQGPDADSYAIARQDGAAVCGLSRLVDVDRPAWLTYLAHDQVDAAVLQIDWAGGSIVHEPADVGPLGRMIVAQDSTGGLFGAWQAGRFVGCEVTNEPGAMIWNELLTTEHQTALNFYAAVFGASFTDIGGDAFTFSTMEVGGNTVGGVGDLVDDLGLAGGPYWRMYFASDDPDATIAAALDLGASVVLPAHDSPFGRWGSLADPQGAAFSVITPPR